MTTEERKIAQDDDPYAPNAWGLKGGCGHTTREMEFSAAVVACGIGLMILAAAAIGIARLIEAIL
jgi:hypothetical protein